MRYAKQEAAEYLSEADARAMEHDADMAGDLPARQLTRTAWRQFLVDFAAKRATAHLDDVCWAAAVLHLRPTEAFPASISALECALHIARSQQLGRPLGLGETAKVREIAGSVWAVRAAILGAQEAAA